LTKLTEASSGNKAKQIALLVRQCLDSLNIYGLDAEALKNRQKTFIEILKDYKIEVITKAFWKYLEGASTPPTAAQIKEICAEINHKTAPTPLAEPKKRIFIQQICDWTTGEVLKTNGPDEKMTPMQIDTAFGGRRVYERIRLE